MKILDIRYMDSSFFCEKVLNRGDIVEIKDGKLSKVKKYSRGIPVGVALQSVVNIDLTKNHLNFTKDEVQQGGKIQIMKQGTVTIRLSKSLRLPVRQNIYMNPKTCKPTWRALGPIIGRTASKQDKYGYVKVDIEL